MKTLNKAICITFALLSVLAILCSIFLKRIELTVLAGVFAGISYCAYKDVTDPQ